MRIIQISDSHIALDTPGRLADLRNCVNAVNAEKPDIVIHTGDVSHNSLAEEYSAARDILDTLTAPYHVLAGNKDTRHLLRSAFHDHGYLAQNDSFIQYSLEQYPTRLIVLDTIKEGDSKGEFCQQRLTHLQTMLEDDSTRPALIFMHHSPYVVDEIPDPWQFHNWQEVEALAELLSKHENIQQVYCGHVHRNVEGTIAGLPVEVLTCIATDLRKGQLSETDRNKVEFRVIELPGS